MFAKNYGKKDPNFTLIHISTLLSRQPEDQFFPSLSSQSTKSVTSKHNLKTINHIHLCQSLQCHSHNIICYSRKTHYFRDGLQESAVISKTFTVDAPLDEYDDGYSFIESFDSMSTTTATSNTTSSASTIKQRPRKSKYNKEHHNHQVSSFFSWRLFSPSR